MFGRTVTIDGRSILVLCTPDTPLWEVLQKAAAQLKAEETEEQAARREERAAHRMAVEAFWNKVEG